jgi:hypothetical protein
MNCWRMPLIARKRELTDTGTDKGYVRRNKLGTSFVESDDVGRPLAADRRKRAKTKVKCRSSRSHVRTGPEVREGHESRQSSRLVDLANALGVTIQYLFEDMAAGVGRIRRQG